MENGPLMDALAIILIRNSPYAKAKHIPGQKEWKTLMITLTGLEMYVYTNPLVN